jgi:lipid A 4'-phosphatase
MRYLKLPRARCVLLLVLTSSLLLAWFPELDLRVSSFFFRGGAFYLADRWWTTLLRECVGYSIGLGLAAVLGIHAFDKFSRRKVCRVDGKVVVYLFTVLVLGAGLVVNVALKNQFGRARPREVTYFGGSRVFTPAFVLSDECDTNCSFSCGDGAGAFFSLALALALSRRRAMLVAAAVFGALVSLSRIASGAHFLSDTVVSFFVMWIIADVLYHYMLLPRQECIRPAAEDVLRPRKSRVRDAQGLREAPLYAFVNVGESTDGAP